MLGDRKGVTTTLHRKSLSKANSQQKYIETIHVTFKNWLMFEDNSNYHLKPNLPYRAAGWPTFIGSG
jgi:hypothetical protein